MSKLFSSLTVLLLLSFIFPSSVFAATYYVNPSGADSGTGAGTSSATPFKSLAKGVSVLVAGDTLYISGDYTNTLTITKSGTASAPIKVIGQNYPKIRVSNGTAFGIKIDGDYVIVDGFDVANANSHGIFTGNKHIQILNNTVHNSVTENGKNNDCLNPGGGWGSGIKTYLGAEDVLIKGNQVYENCGEGIAATRGINIMIENNIVRDNYSVNIYVDNSYNVTVKNNTSKCTGLYLRDDKDDGIDVTRATGVLFGNENYTGWGSQLHDVFVSENKVEGCNKGVRLYNPINGAISNLMVTNNCFTGVDTPYVTVAGATVSNNIVCSSSPTPSPTPKPGDSNGDTKVDGLDYVIWLNHYNQSVTGATNGDFNNSGKVDGLDYVAWLNNYGK